MSTHRYTSGKRFQVFAHHGTLGWVASRTASRGDVLLGPEEERKYGAEVDALPVGETFTMRTVGHPIRIVRVS